MAYTRQTTIWCDGCSRWHQESGTAHSVRKALRPSGWTHRGRRDLCPECSAAAVRDAAPAPVVAESGTGPGPGAGPLTEEQEDRARGQFGRYYCRTCAAAGKVTPAEERFSMGVYAGMYCDTHWATSGYVKDKSFDPSDAGERLEEDDP